LGACGRSPCTEILVFVDRRSRRVLFGWSRTISECEKSGKARRLRFEIILMASHPVLCLMIRYSVDVIPKLATDESVVPPPKEFR